MTNDAETAIFEILSGGKYGGKGFWTESPQAGNKNPLQEKHMWKEFKEFIMRGNVVDLAVGIIMGAAFGQIVSSLVTDIIMPPIGLVIGGIDFSDFYINLSGHPYATLAEAKKAGAATINYGIFLNQVVHFLIVALAVFIMVKQVNKFKKKEDAKLPADVQLLTEIRDLLKQK